MDPKHTDMRTLALKICLIILTVTMVFTGGIKRSNAQVFTGGDFSITFVNGVNLDLAPVIGYKIMHFKVGFSPVVMFTATGTFGGDFSYGARLFGEYDIYKGFLAHAEFEALNSGYISTTGAKQHGWNFGAPIGVGYEHQIYLGVYFKVLILYDVLQNINLDQSSPKANPQIRGGITYSFGN